MWNKISTEYPHKTGYYMVGQVDYLDILSQNMTFDIVKWDNTIHSFISNKKVIFWDNIPELPRLTDEEKKQELLSAFEVFVQAHMPDTFLKNEWDNLNKSLSYSQLYMVIAKIYVDYWNRVR